MCHYHGFVMALIGMVTHLLVCAMAIERLLGIRHGYFYNKNVTTYRVNVVLCSLPLFGLGRFVLQFPGSWCFVDSHLCPGSAVQHSIFTYTYGAINLTALIVMAVCNVIVVGTLLKMRMSRAVPVLQSNDGLHSIRSHKHKELEIQMVFVLLVITTVFVISWGPLDVSLLFSILLMQEMSGF
ncbi:hypothetical protein HAZT_HAZT001926 [Hyalella azteca]|uniref:G-protein coupled receptors family 1 profile domain-containing protein n=1 Tax=Hyalella azteca TaxID=294128 RepID=A0A6A0GSA9_HYAAZ|nr:hypothetical protein HAZT_HAZT001926 [Hyalella azteca]